ncbi:hypothetical protein ACYCO6_30010 [Methylobacterium sp. CM6257]
MNISDNDIDTKGDQTSFSPPTFSERPAAANNTIRPFALLPANLQKKITIEPGGEHCACWLWTGYTRPERRRFRTYPVPAEYDGWRNSAGSVQGERATPEVRDPQKGKTKVPAHRRVYALLTGVHIDDVPTLARCLNDKCVSPYHVLETGLSPKAIRQRAVEIFESAMLQEIENASNSQAEAPADAEAAAPIDVMATLKSERPAGWLDAASAEIECRLPPGSITPEMWVEYAIWDEENPEE